jgi:hypothetical protein
VCSTVYTLLTIADYSVTGGVQYCDIIIEVYGTVYTTVGINVIEVFCTVYTTMCHQRQHCH